MRHICGNCVFVPVCLIDGSADELGWMCGWGGVFTHCALRDRGKRSAAPPAGGAVSPSIRMQQSNRGVPVPTPTTPPPHHNPLRTDTLITSVHPTELWGGWIGVKGWGVGLWGGGFSGTLFSSKPLLMHNSCVSSNFGILLQGFENMRKVSKQHFHSSSSNLYMLYTQEE